MNPYSSAPNPHEQDDTYLVRDYEVWRCDFPPEANFLGEGPGYQMSPAFSEYWAFHNGPNNDEVPNSIYIGTRIKGVPTWDSSTCSWCDYSETDAFYVNTLTGLYPNEVQDAARRLVEGKK